MKTLEFMRRGGRVKRFHGFHLLMENPVGHHTFNVIGILICCAPEVRRELLLAAHQHDLPECITGDLPAPFKRSVEGLRDAIEQREKELLEEHDIEVHALTTDEHRWLKLADSLDGAMHCLEERRLGNTTLDKIFWTFITYVQELLSEDDNAGMETEFYTLYVYICEQWENAGGPEQR
jgi:5'-deoxynucleotidase YfbR-like HD superfamily hydrolase